nr:MAG TPA: hypothetical protein [Caudoviricetes sp.]
MHERVDEKTHKQLNNSVNSTHTSVFILSFCHCRR